MYGSTCIRTARRHRRALMSCIIKRNFMIIAGQRNFIYRINSPPIHYRAGWPNRRRKYLPVQLLPLQSLAKAEASCGTGSKKKTNLNHRIKANIKVVLCPAGLRIEEIEKQLWQGPENNELSISFVHALALNMGSKLPSRRRR